MVVYFGIKKGGSQAVSIGQNFGFNNFDLNKLEANQQGMGMQGVGNNFGSQGTEQFGGIQSDSQNLWDNGGMDFVSGNNNIMGDSGLFGGMQGMGNMGGMQGMGNMGGMMGGPNGMQGGMQGMGGMMGGPNGMQGGPNGMQGGMQGMGGMMGGPNGMQGGPEGGFGMRNDAPPEAPDTDFSGTISNYLVESGLMSEEDAAALIENIGSKVIHDPVEAVKEYLGVTDEDEAITLAAQIFGEPPEIEKNEEGDDDANQTLNYVG